MEAVLAAGEIVHVPHQTDSATLLRLFSGKSLDCPIRSDSAL